MVTVNKNKPQLCQPFGALLIVNYRAALGKAADILATEW
jgi:hypothetical protein